jgi:phosphatidate cytidylyltransferase
MSSLATRAATFLIAIPAVLLTTRSAAGFRVLIAFFSGLAGWECSSMTHAAAPPGTALPRAVLAALAAAIGASACTWPSLAAVAALSISANLAIIGAYVARFCRAAAPPAAASTQTAAPRQAASGILLACALDALSVSAVIVPFSFAGLVRNGLDSGPDLAWFMMLVNWQCDNGALLAGKALGRTPLSPTLSPRKTVEGFAGGCAMGLATALALHGPLNGVLLTHPPVLASMGATVTLASLIALGNVVGDLGMSIIKRGTGTRDTGGFFVGHGGVCDKIDGLLFALPITYAFASFHALNS